MKSNKKITIVELNFTEFFTNYGVEYPIATYERLQREERKKNRKGLIAWFNNLFSTK
jgi:hypothetical protein